MAGFLCYEHTLITYIHPGWVEKGPRGKGVLIMPDLDRTGPMGEGPRTGGGFGKCGGNNRARTSYLGRRAGMNHENDAAANRRAVRRRSNGRAGCRRRGRS
jgi:hypothetical protein